MNKKTKTRTRIAPLFAALLLLGACQEEMTGPGGGQEGGAGSNEKMLTLTLGGSSQLTRATGDFVADGVTLTEEREVKSLALFVKTEASGTETDFHPGSFTRFLSESNRTEEQLTEPLAEAGTPGEGLYTCQVKVHSYSWDNPEVVAIANYHENGLDAQLAAVESWEELLALKTPPTPLTDTNPARPLLMYGRAQVKNWEAATGGVAVESIVLTRLVSRIDIINNSYDTDPLKGFQLETVQIKNARTASLLAPDGQAGASAQIGVTNTDVMKKDTVKILQNADGKDYQRVRCLYAYETPNNDPATNMFLELTGKFMGSGMTLTVPFVRTLTDGTVDTIPLTRNHRYVVTISSDLGSEKPVFGIKSAEWTTSTDSVEMTLPASVPSLTDIRLTSSTGANLTDKVIDITSATGATTLEFKASCLNMVPDAYIGYNHADGYDWNGRTLGGKDAITIASSDVALEKDETFSRTYTVTIPQRIPLPEGDTPQLEAFLCIYNTTLGETVADTIRIKADPVPLPNP